VSEAAAPSPAIYTTNAVCLERHCINPIIPGLMHFSTNVLSANQNRSWKCVEADSQMWKLAGFCDRVVAAYDFAVPVPAQGLRLQEDLVVEQSQKAVTAYVAHLAGMGYDFWDHRKPWEEDECIQSVWRMACYTHFPRCNQISGGTYLRPCASSCETYIRACKVQCCDEAVKCVYDHKTDYGNGWVETNEGYANHQGPSPLCTGAATRQSQPLGGSFGAMVLVATLPLMRLMQLA